MAEGQSMEVRAYATSLGEAGFFGVLAHGQSYLNAVYLLLSFPLGIFYFVFLTTGLLLGIGLSIIGVGLLILLVVLAAVRGLADWERLLNGWLLGVTLPGPAHRSESWRHPLASLRKYLGDPHTWKGLAYLLIKFPFGVFTFVVTVFLFASTLGFLLAPVLYHFVRFRIYNWHIVSAEEALLCLAIGLILALLSVHVLNGLASLWRALSVGLLSTAAAPQPDRKTGRKTGPVIIP